ncbi:protein vein [Anopheles aquasalis]|uniref:protein vein n=1 Tax=Anopheles aquasalis TaxID=42839 RepID=UPI00215B0F25|nr:protein vein [Anopheles aquasalis]XP_050094391.1 protein vein [Anopheles aquasalis]XP_050094392.1 protein vein [Anopheles aquasalis]XP_050094394.1 protein vein [Anopheles aquasalis]XP_050094395.1 protein vein [Anopheles aquasalis]XP_050094396.1 protein vein [Anopheles aquasalis]XP_050094397.1 protein vein [Anopheles aquasalis]XP_050094398.1 protein vein [Anopheles aquasalis]XP_050094399.1 protein vein [Anopheles aquasalis]XP_050094400.1 protein vein [Anopheles aquasalis]XP_050094401.1 
MYLRKWSPVKYLMYLWLAILVWLFSRCDSAATMHLAPPSPYHSSSGHPWLSISSSSSSSSISSSSGSDRYVHGSSRAAAAATSVSSPSSVAVREPFGDDDEWGLSGGPIPPRLLGEKTVVPSLHSSHQRVLPLPILHSSSSSSSSSSRGEGFLTKIRTEPRVRRTEPNGEPGPQLLLPNLPPLEQLEALEGSRSTEMVANGANSDHRSSTSIIPHQLDASEANRTLQLHWASQMRQKSERHRLHRRRWRTSQQHQQQQLQPVATATGNNRNRRESGHGLRTPYGSPHQTLPGAGRGQRRNGVLGGGGGGLPRRYCSARDPATLAFEAPIVCEAKVKSTTIRNEKRSDFAATFEILALHKLPSKGRPLRAMTVRLSFNVTTANDCDIFRGKFRDRGLVREELELGKVYFLFLKPTPRYTNFTILGQPIRKTKRTEAGVLQGVNPNYGTRTTIHSITPNVTRVEGKRVRLVCKVGGQPPPKVVWFKDKRLITRNATKYTQVHLKKRSELIIFNTSLTDTGEYECRAKNRFNNSSAFSATYIKITAPKPTVPTVHSRICDEAHRESFCHNGGTCLKFESLGEQACSCPKGFSGFRCENKDSDFQPTSSNKPQDCTSQRYAGRLFTECLDFFVMDSPAPPALYEYDEDNDN